MATCIDERDVEMHSECDSEAPEKQQWQHEDMLTKSGHFAQVAWRVVVNKLGVDAIEALHMGMINKLYGRHYEYFPISVKPADAGHAPSWVYFLNDREKKVLSTLNKTYKTKFKKQPTAEHNLVFFLGDSDKRTTWSATSGRVPTLRMNRGKLFLPSKRRWLCAVEKLATLGFPVAPGQAMAMGVPQLPVLDIHRASLIAGNSMNFANVCIVQLVALTCFAPHDCVSLADFGLWLNGPVCC
ncbi:unnamed protein product [Symbiodinium necroappetens]|uniref:Uncharacterized protein n=1 Tax=Symbiodinium necroappetens TaxID=1628268 RepID=A0A812NYQ4_9DINO|nr:unnamed protein product [Symbiodinium necroappetens]